MQQWLFDAGPLDKLLANCITDDLITCNNGGLRQKSVYLCFLYDFPSFLPISLTLVNMQKSISAYGMKGVCLSYDLITLIV